MNKDQKGDLVEKLIFEAFKDKYIRNAEAFRQYIKKEYNYEVSTDLYKKIVNYQVKKYGETLSNRVQREYNKYFYQKDSLQRARRRKSNAEKQTEERWMKKIEKKKYKTNA